MAAKHHTSLPAAAAALVALAEPDDAALAEMEAEASSGCSACARALVNAREAAVDLAESVPSRTPSSGLRTRILADGSAAGRARGAAPAAAMETDPSGAVAELHVTGADEPGRREEIERLGALERGLDCERILAQVQRLLGFPVYFVAVLKGELVANRVRHGLPPGLDELLREVPRGTTFCTHCVDTAAPLVVENARTEPFFRRGAMVTQFGVGAYVGVPLKTARGLAVGTLCALDIAARNVVETDIRLLEAFATPVVAELERLRTPSLREAILASGVSGAEVYRAAWFDELRSIVRARAASGHAAALLAVSGAAPADVGASAEPSEVVGLLESAGVGILLAGADSGAAEVRAAAVRKALPGAAVAVSSL